MNAAYFPPEEVVEIAKSPLPICLIVLKGLQIGSSIILISSVKRLENHSNFFKSLL